MNTKKSKINEPNVHLASRDPVIEALSKFAKQPFNQWLPQHHPAATGQFLTAQGTSFSSFSSFRRKFSNQEIVDVLAATAPSHCLDGWAYLSRAIATLLSGDAHTTRHLAYYAQLRSALSLLHCHGIGIFNGINFAVDDKLELHRIDNTGTNRRGAGTHIAAWEALRCWTENVDNSRVFLNSLSFRGVSLIACIDGLWPSVAHLPLSLTIVNNWGVDLKNTAEDRESRNISSYCAHALNKAESALGERLTLVGSIWRNLEPDGQGGFPILDKYLLRRFLELTKSHHDEFSDQKESWADLHERLDPTLREFVSQGFLERNQDSLEPPILECATSKRSGDPHAMVSRALLLLRIATFIIRSSFVEAQIDLEGNDLRSWFDTIGASRGFWSTNKEPELVEDLWDEISFAVDSLDEYTQSSNVNQFEFLNSLGTESILLSQTERACMWGVGR